MVMHIREKDGLSRTAKEDQVVGAILQPATNPSDVDTWHLCRDINRMIETEPARVIYASSADEVETELWKRYPVEGEGLSMFDTCCERWELERFPRLERADESLLHAACSMHKKVLVGRDELRAMGDEETLIQHGFLVKERPSRTAVLVSFNPRQNVINKWREKVRGVERFLQSEFPPHLMDCLAAAMKEEAWPSSHTFNGMVKIDVNVTEEEWHSSRGRWGRRGRRKRINCRYAAGTILKLLDLNKRLSRGGDDECRHAWRNWNGIIRQDGRYSNSGWKELITELLNYIHGVEAKGEEDWKKLAKFIRREARHLKVKLPRRPKLPARPKFGKKAKATTKQLTAEAVAAA